MKKISIVLFLFFLALSLNSVVQEEGDLLNFFFASEPSCAYDHWESHIVEGIAQEGYNSYAPYDRQTDGFGSFTIPTESQSSNWNNAIDYFFNEQYNLAQMTLSNADIPYTVVEFTYNGDIYYMLRENLNTSYIDDNGTAIAYDDEIGSFDFGWGIFIYKPNSQNPIMVSAPHPNDDFVSTYFSVQAFLDYDCQYLMINGAGREVEWWGYNYNNSKSLCDPSRNEDLPFNYFYLKSAQKIREDFDRHELSIQIHSYDWNNHAGRASLQISPGQSGVPTGLPIRDWSQDQNDVVQNTDYIIFNQNELGNNSEVTVLDYYAIYNPDFPTIYQDTLYITNQVNLPGYGNSSHEAISQQDYQPWSAFSPFFHVEYDELPNCFEQDLETYHWFYGFNQSTNSWITNNKFNLANQYYEPFMEALGQSIEAFIEYDDGSDQVPDITSFERTYAGSGVTLSWEAETPYDFDSYLLYVSETPIGQDNYDVYDNLGVNGSNNNGLMELGYPGTKSINFEELSMNQTYYFALGQRDRQGNVSSMSEQVSLTTLPIVTSTFDALSYDDQIGISWTVYDQDNNQGFEIYRKQEGEEYELLDSYITNSELAITSSNTQDFEYYDTSLNSNIVYYYKVHLVNNDNESNQLSQEIEIARSDYFQLTVENIIASSTFKFGSNLLATDDYDEVYDRLFPSWYIYGIYNELGLNKLKASLVNHFDSNSEYHELSMAFLNPSGSETFTLDNSSSKNSERFYIYYDSQLYDLSQGPIQIDFGNTQLANFKLIWGNLQADLSFNNSPDIVASSNQGADISWDVQYPELVDHYSIFFRNEEDSLMAVENLPSSASSYNYVYNANQNLRSIACFIRVHSIDGQVIDFEFPKAAVLIGNINEYVYNNDSNNYLISYPYSSSVDINPFTMITGLYSLGEDGFEEDGIINKEQANLLLTDDVFTLPFEGNYSLQDSLQVLDYGWNLLVNPHPIDYKVSDLMFYYNNTYRSLEYILTRNLFIPTFITIRDGAYVQTDSIKAFESAFVFSMSYDEVAVNFRPNNFNEDFAPLQASFYATLEFSTQSGAKDQLTIGIREGIEANIDPYFDAVKAPTRPVAGISEAYIIPDDSIIDYFPKFQKKIEAEIPGEGYSWNFAFINSIDADVQVRIVDSNLGENYHVELTLNGENYNISENNVTLDCGNSSGQFQGSLNLLSGTPNASQELSPASILSVYPNPSSKHFNIEVVSSKSNYQVSVYNIKGQRVKKFNVRDNKSSRNTLSWGKDKKLKNLASGIYFVKYSDEDTSDIRKICLIK